MTALAIAEAVAIGLLSVLVAGLLRSHARILAALHQVGIPVDARGRPGYPSGRVPLPVLSRHPGRDLRTAADVTGVTPWDEAVSIAVSGTEPDTLLAFLSGGCTTCAHLWDELPSVQGRLPPGTRLVVVAKGSEMESPARLRTLGGQDAAVVMSSQAWEDYQVPASPYFVLVAGHAGTVSGEGSAVTWPEVLQLMAAARGDTAPGETVRARGRRDTDGELAAAGILPGDPRLYGPSIAPTPPPPP